MHFGALCSSLFATLLLWHFLYPYQGLSGPDRTGRTWPSTYCACLMYGQQHDLVLGTRQMVQHQSSPLTRQVLDIIIIIILNYNISVWTRPKIILCLPCLQLHVSFYSKRVHGISQFGKLQVEESTKHVHVNNFY